MNASEPLVSVIVAAYNRRRYIDETIQSVLNQSYPRVELIVVDDGSTDGTYEILTDYAERGDLTLETHPGHANLGQSASINRALDIVSGAYLCILDSDDTFLPEKVARQVAFLEANPSAGLVYSNGYAIDSEGKILHPIYNERHFERNDPNDVLLDCYFLLPQSSMVSRSVMDQAGRFEGAFRSAQDHDMLLRISEIANVAYIPDFLFCYRRHPDSISGKSQDVRWRTGFEILRRAKKRYPYRKSTIRKRRAVLHYRMHEVQRARGQFIRAGMSLLAAACLDPVRATRILFGDRR